MRRYLLAQLARPITPSCRRVAIQVEALELVLGRIESLAIAPGEVTEADCAGGLGCDVEILVAVPRITLKVDIERTVGPISRVGIFNIEAHPIAPDPHVEGRWRDGVV